MNREWSEELAQFDAEIDTRAAAELQWASEGLEWWGHLRKDPPVR